MKRVIVTTALGVVGGVMCTFGAMTAGVALTASVVGWIFLNRMVLGFVIGISGLRLHWALHGAVMGAVVGSLFPYSAYLLGFPALIIATGTAASVIFGVLIELVTTVVCKLPQYPAAAPEKPAAAAA